MWIVYLILIIILDVLFGGGLFLAIKLTHPKLMYKEELAKINNDNKSDIGKEKLARIPFEITLSDGYVIRGDYSLNNASNKYVILVHGYGANREGSIPLAIMFYELGYNVIIYDNRGHGENFKHICTMGKIETKDLLEIIDYTYKKFGEDISLGISGVSLGAATCLLSLKYNPKIKFVLADCPYTNARKLGIEIVNSYHLPGILFINFIEIFTRLLYHFSMKEISAVETLEDNKIPIMLVHGTGDKFIDCSHSKNAFNIINSKKKLLLIDDAIHARSIVYDRNKYFVELKKFLDSINIE